MNWYTITALLSPTKQEVIADGAAKLGPTLQCAQEYSAAKNCRVVVTKGRDALGKFVAEFGKTDNGK